MPVSISKLPEVTNVKDNSFMLITQDGTTKRTMCDQFVTEEEARLDEFSPTVITSKSMSKTGEGDNVDYSSSTYDAPMKDVVLKGKTMVNCIQEPSSQDVVLPYEFEDEQYVTINDTKESGALGVELKGQTLVNVLPSVNDDRFLIENSTTLERLKDGFLRVNAPHNGRWQIATNTIPIKPSTKYLLITEVKNNTVDGRITLANTTGFTTNSLTKVDIGFNGVLKQIITTLDVLEDYIFQGWLDSGTTGFVDIRNTLIEYQNGMENWDIPYFTGMTSCKMPILNSVNQLFDYSLITAPVVGAGESLSFTNDRRTIKVDFSIRRDCYQNVDLTIPSGTYNVSFEVRGNMLSVSNMDVISASKLGLAFVGDSNTGWSGDAQRAEAHYVNLSQSEFTTITKSLTFDESKKITIFYHGWNDNPVGWCEFRNIRIVPQGKTSILSLPEEVVLRSLPNGVCDTFNTRTGVYTQRVGAMVLNGSDPITSRMQQTENVLTTTSRCYLDYASIPSDISMKPFSSANEVSNKLICDILPVKAVVPNMQQDDIESVGQTTAGFSIRVKGKTIAECRQRLAEQPITIQYELATPIITKINLSLTLKSWNTTTHIYSEIPENTLYPILSHSNPTYPVILKPSTKYSIVSNSYSNSHTNSAINFNLGGATASTTVGSRVTTITTPSTLSNELLTMSGRGNKLNNVMVIERDVAGDEPYFEGICDCKTPILSNVGKNLLKVNDFTSNQNGVIVVGDSKTNTITVNGTCTADIYFYSSNTSNRLYYIEDGFYSGNYTTSLTTTGVANTSSSIRGHAGHFGIRNQESGSTPCTMHFSQESMTFTFDKFSPNGCWLRLDEGVVFDNYVIRIQFEANINSSPYEPHKSNITTFEQKDGKTIVLRSLPNGVCDTLNVETKEYVQRIGEVVLCGNNDEMWSVDTRKNNRIGFVSRATYGQKVGWGDGAVISDKLVTVLDGDVKYSMDYTIALGAIANYPIVITVPFNAIDESLNTEKNNTVSINSFKTWLSQNPVTVQYELATPIVSTIDVQGFPYAYTNGHVQLSSGSIEQSLTPKVEYNIATNRCGQITQNTKSLIRQGKLLDDIEDKINQIIEATINDSIMLMKLRNK